MSTPVLPVSFATDPAGIVPVAPTNIPIPVTGPYRDRESAAPHKRKKRKKQSALDHAEQVPSAEDPKGKRINIRA